MSKTTVIIKRTFIFLASVAVIGILYLTWNGAGWIINKPISERYDFCSDEGKSCVATLLDKFDLADEQVSVVTLILSKKRP